MCASTAEGYIKKSGVSLCLCALTHMSEGCVDADYDEYFYCVSSLEMHLGVI